MLFYEELAKTRICVFKDEEELVTFLGKSELRKDEDDSQYEPVKNKLWMEAATVWNLDENFVGS